MRPNIRTRTSVNIYCFSHIKTSRAENYILLKIYIRYTQKQKCELFFCHEKPSPRYADPIDIKPNTRLTDVTIIMVEIFNHIFVALLIETQHQSHDVALVHEDLGRGVVRMGCRAEQEAALPRKSLHVSYSYEMALSRFELHLVQYIFGEYVYDKDYTMTILQFLLIIRR